MTMMILRYAAASPFARKVRIAASLLGLDKEMEVKLADPMDPNDDLRRQNPLGKIPVLLAENGEAIYDSRVIVEYLDQRAGGGKIIPREPRARLEALRLEALADGIADSCLLLVYEGRFRAAEKREAKWLELQEGKIVRGLALLESAPPPLATPPTVGQIALACLLGYRDLRFAGTWRKDHPRLVAWLDKFAAQVPAFAETKLAA